jgi:hypothetical protein
MKKFAEWAISTHLPIKETVNTFISYCVIAYIRSGVNQMSILENSEEILANLKAQKLLIY